VAWGEKPLIIVHLLISLLSRISLLTADPGCMSLMTQGQKFKLIFAHRRNISIISPNASSTDPISCNLYANCYEVNTSSPRALAQ
jgi:hypothetical protein